MAANKGRSVDNSKSDFLWDSNDVLTSDEGESASESKVGAVGEKRKRYASDRYEEGFGLSDFENDTDAEAELRSKVANKPDEASSDSDFNFKDMLDPDCVQKIDEGDSDPTQKEYDSSNIAS